MTWWDSVLKWFPVPVVLLIAGVAWRLIEAKLDKIFIARDKSISEAYAAKHATEKELRELRERLETLKEEITSACEEIADEAEKLVADARTDMQTAIGGPGALQRFEARLVELETKTKIFWGMLERSTADLLLREPRDK